MRKYKNIKKIIGGILLITILVVGSIYLYKHFPKFDGNKIEEEVIELDSTNNEEVLGVVDSIPKEEGSPIKMVMVDVKGEVNAPGAYLIEEGKRVIDAIALAGGLKGNADTSMINLSKKVFDEMTIIIYSKEQVINITKTKEEENKKNEFCHGDMINDACVENVVDNSVKLISINEATKEELMLLEGIGEAKAKDIINYRITNGKFLKLEDLMKVNGIGESLFAKIKENITL